MRITCTYGIRMNVEDNKNQIFTLSHNFPNPFNSEATITYNLKQNSSLKVVLYDINGKEISVLKNGSEEQGAHELKINTKQLNLSAGNYFCSFQAKRILTELKITVMPW